MEDMESEGRVVVLVTNSLKPGFDQGGILSGGNGGSKGVEKTAR